MELAGHDRAEFFCQHLLEFEAHVGCVTECVCYLVKDSPGEPGERLQLGPLDDDLAFGSAPQSGGCLVAAVPQPHRLRYAHLSYQAGSSAPRSEDGRERFPDLSLGRCHVLRGDEGEDEAVVPFVAVALQVAYGVAERVAQSGELRADRVRYDNDLVPVVSGALNEVGGKREFECGEEDHLAAGVQLLAGMQADVEPLGLVVLGSSFVVLHVRYQSVDHLVLIQGKRYALDAVGICAPADVAALAIESAAQGRSG